MGPEAGAPVAVPVAGTSPPPATESCVPRSVGPQSHPQHLGTLKHVGVEAVVAKA